MPAIQEKNDNQLDYNVYGGKVFDLTNQENFAYWDLANNLTTWLPKFNLPSHPKILDLGAGTGNFVLKLSEALPNACFVHLDAAAEMNATAREKYERQGLSGRVEIIDSLIQTADFPEDSFDLVVSVNALNTAPPQGATLQATTKWLKPTGWLYLIDFGREQNTASWVRYLVSNNLRKHGMRYTLKWFTDCFASVRENRKARKDQDNGAMWLHTTEELAALTRDAGFEVHHSESCYRGFSDLVVAKPLPIR